MVEKKRVIFEEQYYPICEQQKHGIIAHLDYSVTTKSSLV